MSKKEKTRWVFRAYEDGEYYKWGMHFFERVFYDHTKLKVFSAEHSYKNKDKYPNYVSTYWRINPEPDKPVSDYDFGSGKTWTNRKSSKNKMNKTDFFKEVRELKHKPHAQYIKLNEGEYNAELRVYSPGSINEWDYMQLNRYHVPYRVELDENGEPYYKQIKWNGDKKWISTYYGIRSQVWNYSDTPDELAEKLVDTVDVDMAKLPEYLRDKQEERERDERIKWESYVDIVKFLLAVVIGAGLIGALFN